MLYFLYFTIILTTIFFFFWGQVDNKHIFSPSLSLWYQNVNDETSHFSPVSDVDAVDKKDV